MQNSVLKTASLAVLLIGLWLMLEGIWNAVGLFSTFQHARTFSSSNGLSGITGILIVLWQTSPFFIGLIVFYQQRALVRWFCRGRDDSPEEISWDETGVISALVLSILGLLFIARGFGKFADETAILTSILAIDISIYQSGLQRFYDDNAVADRFRVFVPILYPIFIGAVLLLGAARFGNIMGRQIEKSLLPPDDSDDCAEAEREEENPE